MRGDEHPCAVGAPLSECRGQPFRGVRIQSGPWLVEHIEPAPTTFERDPQGLALTGASREDTEATPVADTVCAQETRPAAYPYGRGGIRPAGEIAHPHGTQTGGGRSGSECHQAAIGMHESDEKPEERRLPRAVRTGQSDDFPRPDREGDTLEDRHPSIPLRDVVDARETREPHSRRSRPPPIVPPGHPPGRSGRGADPQQRYRDEQTRVSRRRRRLWNEKEKRTDEEDRHLSGDAGHSDR